jgi:hypothetical protein
MELDRTDQYSLSENELKEAVRDYFNKITKVDVPVESISFGGVSNEDHDMTDFSAHITILKHKSI